MADQIYLEPQDTEVEASKRFSAELLAQVRDEVLDLECIEKIYPRVTAPGRVARVASAAASTVQSVVQQVLGSAPQAESSDSIPRADDKRASRSFFSKQDTLSIRVGTAPHASVPETARKVAQTIHHRLGDDLAVKVDVVNA